MEKFRPKDVKGLAQLLKEQHLIPDVVNFKTLTFYTIE